MAYRWLADLVLILHLLFIAFATLGAWAVWRRPALAWLHLPALAWGAYVVLAGEVCPLTPLEIDLRRRGGAPGYDESFIEHYLLPLVYPGAAQGATGRVVQAALGVALLALNALAYALLLRRRLARRGPRARRTWQDAGMDHGYGIESPGKRVGAEHRKPARYLVIIDAAGMTVARLFIDTRELVAEFDASSEEVATMTDGLEPTRGANGPEWDRALEGHSARERAGADVYTLDL